MMIKKHIYDLLGGPINKIVIFAKNNNNNGKFEQCDDGFVVNLPFSRAFENIHRWKKFCPLTPLCERNPRLLGNGR